MAVFTFNVAVLSNNNEVVCYDKISCYSQKYHNNSIEDISHQNVSNLEELRQLVDKRTSQYIK